MISRSSVAMGLKSKAVICGAKPKTPNCSTYTNLFLCRSIAKTNATKVTTLSGNAVPKAANIVPVAFFVTLNLRPTHSIALTKNPQEK